MNNTFDSLYLDLIKFLAQPDTLLSSEFLSSIFKIGKNRASRLIEMLKKDGNFRVIEIQDSVFHVTRKVFYYQKLNSDKVFQNQETTLTIKPSSASIRHEDFKYEGRLELENTDGIPSFRDFNIRLVLDQKNEELIFTGYGGDQDYGLFTTEWRMNKHDLGKAKEIVFKFKSYNSKRSEERVKLYMKACSPSENWQTINIEGDLIMSSYSFEIIECELHRV